MENKVYVDEDILIYAIRYTLGRHTYSVSTVCETIEDLLNKQKLSKRLHHILYKEISDFLTDFAKENMIEKEPFKMVDITTNIESECLKLKDFDLEFWYRTCFILYNNFDKDDKEMNLGKMKYLNTIYG